MRVCPARVLDYLYVHRTYSYRFVQGPRPTSRCRHAHSCSRETLYYVLYLYVYLYDVPRKSDLSTTGTTGMYIVYICTSLQIYYTIPVYLSLFAMPLWGLILTSSTGAQVDAIGCACSFI